MAGSVSVVTGAPGNSEYELRWKAVGLPLGRADASSAGGTGSCPAAA